MPAPALGCGRYPTKAHRAVALHVTVDKPKSCFFSSSQVRDLAIPGRKR